MSDFTQDASLKSSQAPTSSQVDATALLEFGAYLLAALDRKGEDGFRLKKTAFALVSSLTKERFELAISELRIVFLALLLAKEFPVRIQARVAVQARPKDFLEWLNRIDLQRALVAERNLGPQYDTNVKEWMALDKALGEPGNFWPAFEALRNGRISWDSK